MKIEISIEKDVEKSKDKPEADVELTPEQIAEMAARLKGRGALSRADRMMLAKYLLQEQED